MSHQKVSTSLNHSICNVAFAHVKVFIVALLTLPSKRHTKQTTPNDVTLNALHLITGRHGIFIKCKTQPKVSRTAKFVGLRSTNECGCKCFSCQDKCRLFSYAFTCEWYDFVEGFNINETRFCYRLTGGNR